MGAPRGSRRNPRATAALQGGISWREPANEKVIGVRDLPQVTTAVVPRRLTVAEPNQGPEALVGGRGLADVDHGRLRPPRPERVQAPVTFGSFPLKYPRCPPSRRPGHQPWPTARRTRLPSLGTSAQRVSRRSRTARIRRTRPCAVGFVKMGHVDVLQAASTRRPAHHPEFVAVIELPSNWVARLKKPPPGAPESPETT